MDRRGVLAATAIGVALRALVWQDRPLWLDEALSVLVARAPTPWAEAAAIDLHPPLFAVLIAPVAWLGGPVELVRAVSLAASLAAIPLGAALGAAWLGRRGALALAALAAACPPLVQYAQEARPYALGVLAVAGVLLAAGRRAPGALLGWGGVALATQYGAWPVVTAAAAWLAWTRRDRAAVLVAAALGLIALALARGILWPQLHGPGRGLATGHLAPWLWTVTDVVPFTLRQVPAALGWLATGVRAWPAWGVGAAVLALVARGAARDRDLAWLALAPAAALWAGAGLGLHPFGPTRHLLVLAPGVALLAARGAVGVPWVGAACGLLCVAGLALQPALPAPDPRGVVDGLERPWLADASVAPALRVYGRLREPGLPWRSGAALAAALPDDRGPRCLVYAAWREEAVTEALAALGATTRRAGPGVVAACP